MALNESAYRVIRMTLAGIRTGQYDTAWNTPDAKCFETEQEIYEWRRAGAKCVSANVGIRANARVRNYNASQKLGPWGWLEK
jgi:hypothetical protein